MSDNLQDVAVTPLHVMKHDWLQL